MNFSNKANDDDDFPVLRDPNSSAKLASLFTSDSSQKPSLKYVAPKQPGTVSPQTVKPSQPTEGSKSPKETTSILFAAATNLYSHQDGSHKNEGKMMCCITRHTVLGTFVLLIYKSSKQVIVQSVITPKFLLEIHPKNYVSFTDDTNVRWSFHINGQKYEQFLTQIGICRAFSSFNAKSFPPWVAQNLSLGEGPSAKENDLVKVTKYQWTVIHFKKGALIDDESENFTVTLDKDFSSWEMGLLGCQKNLHLIILIPNSQSQNDSKVSLIAYELKVEKVLASSIETSGEVVSMKDPIKKGSLESSKSALISRMAKVGQAMFPPPPPTDLQLPVDSEGEMDEYRIGRESRSRCTSVASSIEEINTSGSKYNINNQNKPYDYKHFENIPGDPNLSGSYQYNMVPQGSLVSYHPMQYQQMHHNTTNNVSPDPILSLLLSESRSQNTDLRIAMSKITDKIDQVSTKVTSLDSNRSKSISDSICGKYDPEELLRRIVDIVEQNRDITERMKVKDEKLQQLNANLTDLMLKNQKLHEEKTELIMDKRSNLDHEQVLSLQEEKSTISSLLTVAENDIKHLKTELHDAKTEVEFSTEENSKLKLNFSQLRNEIDDEVNNLREKLVASEETNSFLSEQFGELQILTNSTSKGTTEKCELLKEQLKREQLKIEENEREMNLTKTELARERGDNQCLRTRIERLTVQTEQLTVDNKKQKSLRNDDYSKNLLINEELKRKQSIIEHLREDLSRLQDALTSDKMEAEKNITELKNLVHSFEEDMAKRVDDTPEMVKKIMNIVYKKFKLLFQSAQTYEGEDILSNILVVIRDTTLQYLEPPEESAAAAATVLPRENNPFRSPDKQKLGPDYVLSRQEHIDKSISKGDYTSTDDQQSETSLGSYEILPNDDSESRLTTTTLTDGSSKHHHPLTNQTTTSSLLGFGKRGGLNINPLKYKIGASSSAETPDEFQECPSEDDSTLKNSSDTSANKDILPPNDFADLENKASTKVENKQRSQVACNELKPPPPPPLFSDSENDEDWHS